jgi:hypothetical protein
MDIPTTQDILELIEESGGPHVSLYMPTHKLGAETQEDRIHLKNLLTSAEEDLVGTGLRRTIAKDMLAPVAALEEDVDFWQHQSEGLAVFVSERGVRRFQVPLALPELAFVLPRFHLKPLFPLLSSDTTFHVLAISANRTHLLRCASESQAEVKLDGLPQNIAQVLWPDDVEKQGQFHSFYAGASGATAVFHGAGGTEPEPKEDLLRYAREVDRVVAPYLRHRGGPLVLACVDYLAPIYREANTYASLSEDHVGGSPDRVKDDDLRAAAWAFVKPGMDAEREEALGRYRALAGTGRTTSDPAEAALAASSGKVDTVFVTVGMQVWGHIDAEAYKVETRDQPGEDDYDLLDAVAAHTLANRGTVYAVEPSAAPEPSGVAAVFRY